MTVVGIARIVARLLGEIAEGVAICVYDAAAHLRVPRELRRRPDVDTRLAGYEAHAWPREDVTGRDNLTWHQP